MKKLGLFLIASLFSVLCLTSCLEGSNIGENEDVGVLTYSSKSHTPVLKTRLGDFGGPSIDALYATSGMGTCYIFYYRIDYDLPENTAGVVEANGYYTVSILACEEIDRYYMRHSLTDTTTLMYEEVPILNGCQNIISYVDDYLFLSHTVSQASDLQLDWDMSYDPLSMMPTEENGERFYDIFIRATKKNSSDKNKVDVTYIRAYNVGSYIENIANKEKMLLGGNYYESSSKMKLRFNFISEIDSDDKITWKSSTQEIIISMILPSNSPDAR